MQHDPWLLASVADSTVSKKLAAARPVFAEETAAAVRVPGGHNGVQYAPRHHQTKSRRRCQSESSEGKLTSAGTTRFLEVAGEAEAEVAPLVAATAISFCISFSLASLSSFRSLPTPLVTAAALSL